ncbi:MAG: hypothetical protein KJ559_01590 [Nanoarchaeota archaeon]|nr:hypothetical protein [Nanoarchaeota archaeon]
MALVRKPLILTEEDKKAVGAIRARAVQLAMEADRRQREGERALEYRQRKPIPIYLPQEK